MASTHTLRAVRGGERESEGAEGEWKGKGGRQGDTWDNCASFGSIRQVLTRLSTCRGEGKERMVECGGVGAAVARELVKKCHRRASHLRLQFSPLLVLPV